ncbi:hypothetical protein [Pectobacterium carotovorum]|uniref:hypothetical protein n=1 Tax=Pectobacterium carotovorum TaxID=554 RepID=UPI0015DF9C77|nr:hypothetical protein [Pectobacterium carotovorum]MBA0174389.1 hypothetical protein [Pectobacterium carotovorum]
MPAKQNEKNVILTNREKLLYSTSVQAELEEKLAYTRVGAPYEGLPENYWPNMVVSWNENPQDLIFSFDSGFPDWISPSTTIVGRVSVNDIYAHLADNSRIENAAELWGIETEDKVCEIIGRWMNGVSITPPALCPEGERIIIAGGNHRFNVARLCGETTIAFFTADKYRIFFDSILPSVQWNS